MSLEKEPTKRYGEQTKKPCKTNITNKTFDVYIYIRIKKEKSRR